MHDTENRRGRERGEKFMSLLDEQEY
jgi:hypothetical protein